MTGPRRRSSLDRIAPALAAAVVFVMACRSGSVPELVTWIGGARWVALGLFVVFALVWAWRASPRRAPGLLAAIAVSFLAVMLVSAAWSVDPTLTVKRALTLVVLFVAAAASGVAVRGQGHALEGLLSGVLAGAVAVAVAGLVLLLVDSTLALEHMTAGAPERLQGIGENPNTASMLYALASPIAAAVALRVGSGRRRLAGLGALALLIGSIFGSDSHGAIFASLVAVVLVALTATRRWPFRLAVAAGVVAVFVAGLQLNQLRSLQHSAPAASASATQGAAAQTTTTPAGPGASAPAGGTSTGAGGATSAPGQSGSGAPRSTPANGTKPPPPVRPWPYAFIPEPHFVYDVFEVGRPRPGGVPVPLVKHSVLGSSGRGQAWQGALDQARIRPLLGYGFGTEDHVFLDHFYVFLGLRPENSYIGLLLQLGVVGLALFVAILLCVTWRFVRLVRCSASGSMGVIAAAGVFAAGVMIATGQSFVYSVGSVASFPFWLATFALAIVAVPSPVPTEFSSAGVAESGRPTPWWRYVRTGRLAIAGAVVAALVIAVPVGRWERSHAAASVGREMRSIAGAAWPSLVTAELSDWYTETGRSCLLYRSGANPYAYSVCFDTAGRLVRATDERSGSQKLASMEWEPRLSSLKVDPALVSATIALVQKTQRLLSVESPPPELVKRIKG